MDIILYLIQLIQHLYKQNCWLVLFICKYIPLKQWAYDDSHSPKYQKFKIDTLPKIICHKQDWQWSDLLSYYKARYNKDIKPVFRHRLRSSLLQIRYISFLLYNNLNVFSATTSTNNCSMLIPCFISAFRGCSLTKLSRTILSLALFLQFGRLWEHIYELFIYYFLA